MVKCNVKDVGKGDEYEGKGRGKDTTPDHSMGGEGTVLFSL